MMPDRRTYSCPAAPTPDAAVENRQRLDDLRGAFRGLSESHHKIIVMREFEGLSYDQIGQRLGMSKAMVESTLFRARKRLGEEYEELVSGRRCEQIQAVIASGEQRPLRSLGIRDRRQLARHLSHCQPCRRCARMAGVDESFFHTPGVVGKIAALLPFPWLRWRRSHTGDEAVSASGTHQLAALQSLQGMVRIADPSAPTYGLGRAVATAAAVVIAGAGGGLVSGLGGRGGRLSVARPALRAHSAPPAAAASSGRKALGSTVGSGASTVHRGSGGVPSRAGGGSGSAPSRAAGSGSGLTATGSPSGASGATSPAGTTPQQPQAAAAATAGTASGLGGLGSTASKLVNGGSGSTTPTLPNVNVPPVQNPVQNPLPPLPQPQLPQVPTVSTPKPPQIQVPSVPTVSVPDPSSLVPPLGQKSG